MDEDPSIFDALKRKVQELSDALESITFTLWKKTGSDSNSIQGAKMQSVNFKTGVSGWELTPSGNLEANSGTFRGALVANSLDIPDTTTANSFHVNTAGDAWWGATTFASAVASISKAGAALFSSIGITGGTISGASIASIPNDTVTNISLMECSHDLVFSVTDADTIAWATGTIVFSNGRTFTIDAGNTGNMAALTYIYLDPAVSSTVLQTTTTYSTAMGANKRLIGTAQNHTVTASFIPYGAGVPLIDGANIGALSIVAGNIAATTITSAKMNVSQLSAITADLGAITAGTVTLDTSGYMRGGQTDYNTGTGFFLGYSGAAYKFSVGNPAGNYIGWDGSTLTIIGNQVIVTTYTSGSGTWTKATGAKSVHVQAWGGGGAGGGGTDAGFSTGGGGGGAYVEHTFNAADLGATEAYAVGAGGTGGTGNGAAGGNTTFDILTAYGGGGGGGDNSNGVGGGGGGGSKSAGASATTVNGGAGGSPLVGAGGTAGVSPGTSVFGGGGGGSDATGGESVYGGGGGAGSTVTGDGGASWKGGGGGASFNKTGGASTYGGSGGTGPGVNTNGNPGTAPGGGGSAVATNNGTVLTGGSGGSGRLIITEYL